MSLKARLKRLEAEVEWLEMEGWLLSLEQQLKLLETKEQLADHVAAHPEKAAELAAAGVTFVKLTPRPPPPSVPPRLVVPAASPAPEPTPVEASPPAPLPAEPPEGTEAPPPRALPPVEPVAEPFTYDPPEHLQYRPVRRRRRRPHDEDDWNDLPDDEDYDPLADLCPSRVYRPPERNCA